MLSDDLATRFIACTLPKSEWTHAAHLIVGAWHVRQFGATAALELLRSGILRMNDSPGTVNSATSGYHETVTAAYVRVIAAHLAECEARSFEECVETLVAGPLGDKNVLLTFYSRELLFSERARAEWVEPDRAPLP